jgi:hypothetical protein
MHRKLLLGTIALILAAAPSQHKGLQKNEVADGGRLNVVEFLQRWLIEPQKNKAADWGDLVHGLVDRFERFLTRGFCLRGLRVGLFAPVFAWVCLADYLHVAHSRAQR